jgi:hypothetical protein
MLGTNPIAIAFPGCKEPPIVIDMATSAVAYGKIEIALRKKAPIPKGWIVDKDGGDTTDPQDMIDGGSQLPLGSDREMGGHKGYGLASMVDILCCVLSGANWGPFAPPFALRQEIPARSVGKGIGHFFGAMQIDGFIDKDEFKKQIDEWIQVFPNFFANASILREASCIFFRLSSSSGPRRLASIYFSTAAWIRALRLIPSSCACRSISSSNRSLRKIFRRAIAPLESTIRSHKEHIVKHETCIRSHRQVNNSRLQAEGF